jgi:hypothetical protein
MRWNKEGVRENNQVMVHPFDGGACNTLDNFGVDFTRDVRNIRIGLATDGFTSFD